VDVLLPARCLIVLCPPCAGGGVVWPLVVYGGAHPCSRRHSWHNRFIAPLMIHNQPPYISRIMPDHAAGQHPHPQHEDEAERGVGAAEGGTFVPLAQQKPQLIFCYRCVSVTIAC
jgi:hypothetical protein